MMNLAIVLKQYLWAQKMSNKEFADQRGISASSVGRFLNGTKSLDGSHLASLVRWLLEEPGEPTA